MPSGCVCSGRVFGAALALLACGAGEAAARILAVEPVGGLPGMIIPAPAAAQDDVAASATHMLGFDERQDVVLRTPIETDQGVIPAGTRVSSHLILLNLPDGSPSAEAANDWIFSGPVIGVMSDAHGLREAASTPVLGAPGTAYPPAGSHAHRGLEWRDGYEGVGTPTLRVRMWVLQPGDWVRVITADQPVAAPRHRIEEARLGD